jgi:hypothetical protein
MRAKDSWRSALRELLALRDGLRVQQKTADNHHLLLAADIAEDRRGPGHKEGHTFQTTLRRFVGEPLRTVLRRQR